ncbi:MAG: recombinase family protein [Thermoguttaceae bacterium]
MSTATDESKLYVSYYRVSTKKQGDSGLGLEAQQRDVATLTSHEGGTVIADYVEVETGKMAARPKLQEAINHARLSNATLVVAKLDRLARNVLFTAALMESGVDFVACDNPKATRFTIHILAAVAEQEAAAISRRTKDALLSAKLRGKLLGSQRPGFWDDPKRAAARQRGGVKGRPLAWAANAEKARKHYAFLLPEIKRQREEGATLQQIVDWLSERRHTTRRGTPFTVKKLREIIARYLGKEYLGNRNHVLQHS